MLTALDTQAIAVHFLLIGNDPDAARRIKELDNQVRIGNFVGCMPRMFAIYRKWLWCFVFNVAI